MGELHGSAVETPGLAEALVSRGLTGASARLLVPCSGDPLLTIARYRRRPLILLVADPYLVANALDAGADDALAAGAPVEEIAARIAARLRAPALLTLGALTIDRATRRVTREGRAIPLHPREYALLLHLASRPGETVTRAELLAGVWGLRFDPGTNLLAVHVSRLRAKLDRGFAKPMLLTEKGIGYRLDAG